MSMNNRRKSSGGLLEEVRPISRDRLPAFLLNSILFASLFTQRDLSFLQPGASSSPRIYFKHILVPGASFLGTPLLRDMPRAGRNSHTGWQSVDIKYQIYLSLEKPDIVMTGCGNEVIW